MALTTYCTDEDIDRLLSSYGVASFADHDEDGSEDTGVVLDCREQASEEINLYTRQWYLVAGLSSSALITRWCTVMSAYFLSYRRGNPPPESLQIEFNRIVDDQDSLLQRVHDGNMRLPGVALDYDARPSVSNVTIDRRFARSKIRVDERTSSDSPTTLSRDAETEFPMEL